MNPDTLPQTIKWIIGAVASGLLFLLFFKYLYQPLHAYIESFFVVRQLLKETRPTRNALKGKHLADRLLDIWNNGKPLPLVSRDVVYSRGQFWHGVWLESVVDKKLQDKGLVEIYHDRGQSHVRLSNNLLTKLVITKLNKLVDNNRL